MPSPTPSDYRIAGRAVEALVDSTFEEAICLCLQGLRPSPRTLAIFDAELKFFRGVPVGILNTLKLLPRQGHPLSHLRTAISMLGVFEVDGEDTGRSAEQAKAQRLCAQAATLAAAIYRIGEGREPLPPRRDLNHAANFLFMTLGREPDPLLARHFERLLLLLAAEPEDDSTLAARHIAATDSDLHSAILGALGALKGPLAAGANEAVMRTLLRNPSPELLDAWLERTLATGCPLHGFASRTDPDPRMEPLRDLGEDVAILTGDQTWFKLTLHLELQVMKRVPAQKPVPDLLTASTLYQLGLPFEIYTSITTLARLPGWIAEIRAARHPSPSPAAPCAPEA